GRVHICMYAPPCHRSVRPRPPWYGGRRGRGGGLEVKIRGARALLQQSVEYSYGEAVEYVPAESARQSRHAQACRGKSGLHRARCQVTPGRREPTESATESRPPMARSPQGRRDQARVKRCGKSAPRAWQQAGTANPTGSKTK